VSIIVFQPFDRNIFGTLTFPGTRWYVLTARDPQMVCDQKKFGNHCYMRIWNRLNTFCIIRYAYFLSWCAHVIQKV